MFNFRSYYVIGREWIWGPIGCAIFTFMQNFGTITDKSLSEHKLICTGSTF